MLTENLTLLQIEELRADIDQHQCTEISLRQKNVELEELLQEQLNQTEVTHTKSFSNSEELNLLQEEVGSLQSENVSTINAEKLNQCILGNFSCFFVC